MAFSATPLDGSPTPIPMSSVIPDGTNTPIALEGGPSISSGGNNIAPASMYVKDGNNIALGASTDASNANSVIGQLKQIKTNTASITIGSLAAGTNTIGGVELVDSGGTNKASISSGGALKVDGSAVTQPVSGTVTANAGTGSFTVAQATGSNLHAVLDSGSTTAVTQATGTNLHTVVDSGTVAATQSGTWNVTNVSGTVSLPTGAATSAKQPALGTAGTASTDVLSVQGIASMTALKVDGSAVTQPVSGTVTANQGGAWTVQPGNTANTTAWKVDGSGVTQPVSGTFWQATQPVSGTMTVNAGTNLNTSALALDTSVNGVLLSQGSTTSGEKGPLVQGAVTTNAPSYTTAQTSPISLDASGLLRASLKDTPSNTNNFNVNLAASAATVTVSGTVTANAGTGNFTVAQATGSNLHAVLDSGSTTAATQATASNLNAQVIGSVASAGANAGNPVKIGAVFNTTQPTVTNGQIVDAQATARGAQIVATGTDTFNVTVNAALPAGASTIGNVGIVAGSAVIGGVKLIDTGGTNAASISAGGAVKVDGSGVTQPVSGTFWQTTQPVSGTITANAGTGNFQTQLVDSAGTNVAGIDSSHNVLTKINAALPAGSAVIGSTTIQATSGTALVADQSNTELRASLYGKNSTAGDTALKVNSAGDQYVLGDFTEVAGNGTGVVNGANTDLISSTDVSSYKWLSLQLAGTWSATFTFQCSNDNANWVSFVLSSPTPGTTNNSATTSANGIFVGLIPTRYIRVRATAWTSNASLVGTLELYTIPPPIISQYATQAGVWTSSLIASSTNGNGSNDGHLISAATTNATSLKASGGLVFGYEIFNTNAATRYVKLTNASAAPTPGTTAVSRTIGVPPSGRASFHSTTGMQMNTGIGFYTCTGIADSDSTAVGANDLSIDIDWK